MTCDILFTHRAEKDLSKLPKKDTDTILQHCAQLGTTTPLLDIKKLHPPLSGFRLRVGNYRVLYVQESKHTITIHAIVHRKDAYR